MSDLDITAEWIEAEGLQGPELQATWCALSIEVGGSVATRVLSRRARTVRDAVFLPAYPLAEWLATSWWLLFEQRENPQRTVQRWFQETHSLRFAREGYALPDLAIVSMGSTCRLEWRASPLNPYGIEFLSSGRATLPTTTVRAVLRDFVDQVVARLYESGVEGTLLQDEWQAILALEDDEMQYCLALASVGLDPFSANDDDAAAVAEAFESLPENLFRELSAVVDGAGMGAAAVRLSDVLSELQATGRKLQGPADLRAALACADDPVVGDTPWGRGYAEARRLRGELGLNGTPVASLDRLGEVLSEDNARVAEVVEGRDLALPLVHGIMTATDDGAFALQLAPTHPQATLFHLTRALGSYLFGDDTATALTRASSDLQARFRAFAAEFLAPAEGLRSAVSGETIDQEEVDDLAVRFGVSPFVIHHQLQNHAIADTAMEPTDDIPGA